MKKNWKLACTVIMIAGVGLFWACGDDGPASPTSMDPLLSATPQVSASTSDSPANPTYTERPDLDPKRGNNPFGSGYACEDYPIGIGPVWREDEQGRISKWTIWTIKNTTDQRWRVSGKVYGEKEPGCVKTVRGRKGADDILIIEDPEWIEVGETRDVRWRIDMNPMYNEDYLCGRFQFGIGLKPETHGNFWNHTDRVIDTGSDECEPPKKGCPANAFVDVVVTLPDDFTTGGRECPDWYPVTYTINSNLPTVNKTIPPEYVPGKGLPVKDNPYSVTFSAVGKSGGEVCARDSETVPVSGCDECTPCQNESKPTINIADGRGDTVIVSGNATFPGTVTFNGKSRRVKAGQYSLTFDVECGETYEATIVVYDDSCGGEPIRCGSASDTHTTPDCPSCVDVTLDASVNIDGNNIVHTSATGSGATNYTFMRHNMGSQQSISMPWNEDFQLDCEKTYLAHFRAFDGDELCEEKIVSDEAGGCEVCETCQEGEYEFDVDTEGDTLIVDSSLPFTVDRKGYQPGHHEITFEIDCEGEKTVTVQAYDTSCNTREVCESEKYTLYGEDCEGCVAPELTLEVETSEGDNETEVCFDWLTTGDLSGGTLTLDTDLGHFSEVEPSGYRCIDVSCEDAGEYIAELNFAHNDIECSDSVEAEYYIDECEEVCETCQDYSYSAHVEGSTLVVDSSLPFTVDEKTYQPGHHEISFEIDCEGEKTVTVDVYDTSCDSREVCESKEYTLYCEPFCESNPPSVEDCYAGNLKCEDFGLEEIGEDGSSDKKYENASMSADVALVKGGPKTNVYLNVGEGDRLYTCRNFGGNLPKVSHVLYCKDPCKDN